MDWTPFEHAAIAVLCQLIGWFVTGDIYYGACLGIGIMIGREHSQAEDRWMSLNHSSRKYMPEWAGFDPKVWDWASILDIAVPLAFCTAIALAAHYWL